MVEKKLGDWIGPAQYAVDTASSLDEAVACINRVVHECINSISEKHVRVLVPRRVNAAWTRACQIFDADFKKVTGKGLKIETDVIQTYRTAKNDHPLVEVIL